LLNLPAKSEDEVEDDIENDTLDVEDESIEDGGDEAINDAE